MSRFRFVIVFTVVSTCLGLAPGASDWPQLLRDSRHSGDAAWSDGDILAPRPEAQSVKVTLHLDRASVYAYQIVPAE